MTAAELGFDNLPKSPSWVQLAENVFNAQVGRWDDKTCAGGLRWQVFPFNNGYDYKNALSNGAFFQLATRLARYTGNQTYADWAEKIFTWSENVGFITKSYAVYDGSNVLNACSSTNQIQWTINSALYLYGSAIMYDIVSSLL
jgi:mannan endo-1,6-alpha-mannosidase